MPLIPLPDGLVGAERLPHTRRSLTNCFNNGEGQIISVPGITLLNTTGSVARGQFVWNDNLYQVVSNSLIKITDTSAGTFTTNGTAIAGNANIVTAIGFNTAVILVPGGNIYTLDKSDVLTVISGNANFVASDWVTHIDGRFIYIPTSGDPAFFSDVGAAGTVQALSFFDAEELPDENEVAFNLNNTLYIGGTDSFELFQNTGASPVPFQRIAGARISAGYIGGLIEYNKTFFFIGRLKDQGFGIFAIGQGEAPKISNAPIDLILTDYTEDELAMAVGGRFNWRGYDIATFTLARDSFGFFNGNWFLLDTIDAGSSLWQGGFINQFEGNYFAAFNANIGRLDLINTIYGLTVTRIIDVGFEQEDSDFFTAANIGIDISQGFISSSSVGSELIINGDFPTNLTGWTDGSSAGGSIAQNAGKMDLINATGAARAVQTVTAEIGESYLIKFTGSNLAGQSSQQFFLGSVLNGGEFEDGTLIDTGVNTFTIVATTTLISVSFRNFGAATTFSIDDVTITKILTEPRTVGLFMSRDNVTYGNGLFREVGAIGEYSNHLEWNYPGGLGMYDGFMGVRFKTTQSIDFAVDKMFANFR